MFTGRNIQKLYIHTHKHTHTHIYILHTYIYIILIMLYLYTYYYFVKLENIDIGVLLVSCVVIIYKNNLRKQNILNIPTININLFIKKE